MSIWKTAELMADTLAAMRTREALAEISRPFLPRPANENPKEFYQWEVFGRPIPTDEEDEDEPEGR